MWWSKKQGKRLWLLSFKELNTKKEWDLVRKQAKEEQREDLLRREFEIHEKGQPDLQNPGEARKDPWWPFTLTHLFERLGYVSVLRLKEEATVREIYQKDYPDKIKVRSMDEWDANYLALIHTPTFSSYEDPVTGEVERIPCLRPDLAEFQWLFPKWLNALKDKFKRLHPDSEFYPSDCEVCKSAPLLCKHHYTEFVRLQLKAFLAFVQEEIEALENS